MTKYKCGAIIKDVPKGAEKWYVAAGWKRLEEKEKNDDKTNTKKTATT